MVSILDAAIDLNSKDAMLDGHLISVTLGAVCHDKVPRDAATTRTRAPK